MTFPAPSRTTTRRRTRFTRTRKVAALSRVETSEESFGACAAGAAVDAAGASVFAGASWACACMRAAQKAVSEASQNALIVRRVNGSCNGRAIPSRLSVLPYFPTKAHTRRATRHRPVARLYAAVNFDVNEWKAPLWVSSRVGDGTARAHVSFLQPRFKVTSGLPTIRPVHQESILVGMTFQPKKFTCEGPDVSPKLTWERTAGNDAEFGQGKLKPRTSCGQFNSQLIDFE